MRTVNILLFFLLCYFTGTAQQLSLAGQWRYRLDPSNTGIQQRWMEQSFEKTISLPGTLDDAGIGAPPEVSADSLSKTVMLMLARRHSYIGAAWYSREITIPAGWKDKHITLLLERVIWNTRVWIDGKEAGTQESLSVPQRFDLSRLLQPGKHLLVMRIDNSRQYDMSTRGMAHAYTNGTQIIWNGVIGKMELVARGQVYLDQVQVYPDIKNNTAKVRVALRNALGTAKEGILQLTVLGKDKKTVAAQQVTVQLPAGASEKEITIALGKNVALWDEFNGYVYTLTAQLRTTAPAGREKQAVTFGMRAITNEQSLLQINGRRLFLRGTLECNIFPLTGHPPMDKKGWLKVFTTAKAYGLNHIRFHSWCPPEAAFEVADSLGIYVQVELPFWNKNAGKDTALNRFLEEEAYRISREYGNHPSFCLWSMGNELEGDFSWLAKMVRTLRQHDPRHLYTSTTFTFAPGHGRWPEPGDDYFITQYTKKGWVRGQGIFNTYAPGFATDYTAAIDSMPVPVITHEIGQYSVYPNLDEIKKYTGVLDPLNFKAVRNDLQRKGLLPLAPQFTLASGKFSANLYKEEIERALKTKGFSGFELLDLHDFPGQGTALVGILDAFWDSKGLTTPAAHRRYCSAVVPLIRFPKAVYTSNETFSATAEVANFGSRPLQVTPVWKAKDPQGRTVASGRLKAQTAAVGNGIPLGAFSFSLQNIHEATALTIELQLQGTSYSNSWEVLVYPERLNENKGDVLFTTDVTTALQYLQEGKKVLLNPDTASIYGVEGRFAPVFWSPVHFPDQPGTMGILCNPKHPALAKFPTEFYSNWQWWDLITHSKTMILDGLPDMQPIVRVIDNFFKNRRMANVIEARVGKGRLVLVSADITHALEARPAARQLRYSLEQYMQGNAFNPTTTLSATQLQQLVKPAPTAHNSLEKARANYAYLKQHLPADRFPVTFYAADKKLVTTGATPWVCGFYPGTLLYLYEATKDTALYREALRKLKALEKEQYDRTTHDLGFMMYCSFGNARRITPDAWYDSVIVTSARSLASRFSPVTGCIRSWDSDAGRFMVIIDNMMNLELLMAATRITGDSSFYRIAVTHANTTMANHFRPDYSSYHLVIYDPATGKVQKKQTVQGAADSSAWARGQAWGLYGYTMMYRETKDRKYLEQADHIAQYMLRHLPADNVFYWDFQAPGIPNAPRDASAAAIACSALLELSGYTKKDEYLSAAKDMLHTLSSPAYLSRAEDNGGFILKHGVGNFPKHADIDVPLVYADYYYVEALMRYRKLSQL